MPMGQDIGSLGAAAGQGTRKLCPLKEQHTCLTTEPLLQILTQAGS